MATLHHSRRTELRSIIARLGMFSGCVLTFGHGLQADDLYRVEFSADLNHVTVQACFDGQAPRSLHRNKDAGKYTQWLRSENGRSISAESRGENIRLPRMPPDSCIAWSVDLANAIAAGDYRLAYQFDHSILTAADLWFWRDNRMRNVLVDVTVPDNMGFPSPWETMTSGEPMGSGDVWIKRRYRPEATPATWSARVAVGQFEVESIRSGGSTIDLAAIGALNTDQKRTISRWINHTSDSLASVYDRFPQPRAQVLVVPIGRRSGPVPWAHVLRGGGIAIEFFIDENRTLDELTTDWTATHEFSHLLLPYIAGKDRWLSEGLASYYQNVIRARDGRLSEQEAWQKLFEGFERGRNAEYQGSLARASEGGWGATMRIYWSGAALMLKADAQLRRETSGRQSLDSALARLNACCLPSGKRWQARELLQKLDELTGTKLFSDIYDQHIYDTRFPDVSETLARLGVNTRDKHVTIEQDAPWSRIRYYIMNG